MGYSLQDLFLKIVNMSITSCYVIIAIIVIRALLRKAPKMFSYVLWSVVGFRLICPISFSFVFSLFNGKYLRGEEVANNNGMLNYIPSNIGMEQNPHVVTGISSVSNAINKNIPIANPISSANPLQIIIYILSILWVLGIVIMVIYSIVSYLILRYRVKKAVLREENIYECDRISAPFVLGIIKPKIYIPFRLSNQELNYILRHERYHLHRFDHIMKPFAYLLSMIHWFNPLVWLAFHLMSKDMEMSCDEKVISEIGSSMKGDYSKSLLSFASGRRLTAPIPLAFGESGTKGRIKNVMRFRKPKLWVIILVCLVCVVTVAICITNPVQKTKIENNSDKTNKVNIEQKTSEKDLSEDAALLFANKNKYIGNPMADGKLMSILGIFDDFGAYKIELETKKRPYVLHINFETEPKDEETLNQKMCGNAAILLALIENADDVQWSYPGVRNGESAVKKVYFTKDDREQSGIKDIKSYGKSEKKLMELMVLIQKLISSNALYYNYDVDLSAVELNTLQHTFGHLVTYNLPKGYGESKFIVDNLYGGKVLF